MGASRSARAKQPRVEASPETTKKPSYLGVPNWENRHIAWRLSCIDKGGPFQCGHLTHDERQQIWNKLQEFERMGPAEFKRQGSFHEVAPAKMQPEAKQRLKDIELDDLDALFSFHIDGTKRLWCMKHENILSVLWWDPNHKVYRVPKKHT